MGGILQHDRLAADVAHESGFLPAMRLVNADEVAAELLLEYVRQVEDWRLHLDAGEPLRRRQSIQIAEESGCIAAVRRKRDDEQHAQCRVQHDPEPASGNRRLAPLRCFGKRAVQAAHGAIRIPEETDTRQALVHPPLRLVSRIETYAEKAEPDIVELLTVGQDTLHRGTTDRVAGRGEKT